MCGSATALRRDVLTHKHPDGKDVGSRRFTSASDTQLPRIFNAGSAHIWYVVPSITIGPPPLYSPGRTSASFGDTRRENSTP